MLDLMVGNCLQTLPDTLNVMDLELIVKFHSVCGFSCFNSLFELVFEESV